MTAAELYECDPGFRGFMAAWEADRRCPLELVDYLLDRDMAGPAECARWAHEGDGWEVWDTRCGEQDGFSGRFPWVDIDWSMFRVASPNGNFLERAHRIPSDRVASGDVVTGPTPALAIVALMDAWVVPVVVEESV